ncbi:hypothetical protein BU23DRAFT_627702 [Bimuria novae-zelandiae CBS 107.79]|uniref:Uncharacterized protein n=1 Tax=Bimuria novae-zelandiae CBS 107.79 TaxID=1447943 RepID=A0A6A5UNA5_9PLEO|nr:hypothetical protein BU23DRAFT_627702 [Bimuria novae-zelandiae CBS 107.79]
MQSKRSQRILHVQVGDLRHGKSTVPGSDVPSNQPTYIFRDSRLNAPQGPSAGAVAPSGYGQAHSALSSPPTVNTAASPVNTHNSGRPLVPQTPRFLTMAQPKLGMADAMRAALPYSSPRSSPGCDMTEYYNIMHSRIAIVNAQLDKEAAQGRPLNHLPLPLREFKNKKNVGDFAAMVNFANTEWQHLVKWRNCEAHKEWLSGLDLSQPKEAILKMADEIHRRDRADNKTDGLGSGGSQTVGVGLLDPSVIDPRLRSATPSTTGLSSSSAIPSNSLPTPTPSPKPGSAQEHLQQSRKHLVEGHMPHLSSPMDRHSYNGAVNGSPYNGNVGPNAQNQHEKQEPYGPSSVYRRLHGAPAAAMPGNQHEGERSQIAPSYTRQPTQQAQQQHYNHPPFNTPHYNYSVGPHSTNVNMPQTAAAGHQRRMGSPQAQPQQRNGDIKPYAEFAAESQRHHQEHPTRLCFPGNPSSPHMHQPYPHAQGRAPQQDVENAQSINGHQRKAEYATHPNNCNTAVATPRVSGPGLPAVPGTSYPRVNNAMAASPRTYNTPSYSRCQPADLPRAALPRPAPKTQDQLDYEHQVDVYNQHQADNKEKARLKHERHTKMKAELDAEMKIPDNDVLAYRYRDYLEIYPCQEGERKSMYHLKLLANQVIPEDERSEEAMAIWYAREKWWNFWTVRDKQMIIEELREKRMAGVRGMVGEMATGGHLITAADIDAIRSTAMFTSAEGVVNFKEGTLEG